MTWATNKSIEQNEIYKTTSFRVVLLVVSFILTNKLNEQVWNIKFNATEGETKLDS